MTPDWMLQQARDCLAEYDASIEADDGLQSMHAGHLIETFRMLDNALTNEGQSLPGDWQRGR